MLVGMPSVLVHPARDVRMVTHVDDFLVCATREQLGWLSEQLARRWDLKKHILGPDAGEERCVEFLGRRIRWLHWGLQYEPDPKHVEELLRHNSMKGCSEVSTPAVAGDKEVEQRAEEAARDLSDEEARAYRKSAAILNYLSQDRPDISFAAKEIARAMSQPTGSDVLRLKRVLRYLQGYPRVASAYPWQHRVSRLTCEVDSDWAGCTRARKSTSGGALFRGVHLLTRLPFH